MAWWRQVPAFEPHPFARGGHLQTLAGRYLPGRRSGLALRSRYHEITLEDGDRLCLFDSVPDDWRPGDPAVLLVHGLAGCARSPYVVRLARRLTELGYRAVRMNLRGAGVGFGLARRTYHSGRTDDVRVVADWITGRSPGSPLALLGFSLGGNLVLKLAAEAADEPLHGLDCVLAANPPLDLSACCRYLKRRAARPYDGNFVRLLTREVRRLHKRFPELGPVPFHRVGTLYDFDMSYTAPSNGFADAEDYYARCSSRRLLGRISVPGLIVQAEDDPFIPPEPYRNLQCPAGLSLELLPTGGHLGFLSRTPWGGDRRWLDSRLVAWLAERWDLRAEINQVPDSSRTTSGPEGAASPLGGCDDS